MLLGILAVQMDFIDRDQLMSAMNAWVLDKAKPLEEILTAQSAWEEDERALLVALVEKHLHNHGRDPTKSLASVSSIGSLREELTRIQDVDIDASLEHVPAVLPDVDPFGTQAATLSVGESTSLGQRFRILRPHAKGGLGQVSVALDGELNREVALKEIQSDHAFDAAARDRFLQEAEVTGGLEHPSVVPVYGLGYYADGRPFYAMRLIRGNSLKDAIRRFHAEMRTGRSSQAALLQDGRAVEFRQLLGRFVDVCNAIEYAHSRGVLHRDLKPGNIMLGKYGETLVVDWGLAKVVGRDHEEAKTDEPTMRPTHGSGSAPTQMGSVVGTPAYMSPEQAAGQLDQFGPTSDVYGLGATLYYLLVGKPPVEDKDIGQVLKRVQNGDFPAPREINSSVPKPLEAICLKAMMLKPKDRYASPSELASEVERWLADEPVHAFTEPLSTRTWRWVRRHQTVVGAVIAAVVIAALGLAAATIGLARFNQQLVAANDRASRAARDAREQAQDARQQRSRAETSYRLARAALEDMSKLKEDPRLKSGQLEDLRQRIARIETSFYEDFLELQGDDPDFQYERASAFSGLAYTTHWLGSKEESLTHARKGIAVLEGLVKADPDNSRYLSMLAHLYNTTGITHIDLGQNSEAEQAHKQATKYYKRLVAANPKQPRYRYHYARSQVGVGDWHYAESRLSEAAQAYDSAGEEFRELARQLPDEVSYRAAWAACHNNLGAIYLVERKLEAAKSEFQTARDVLEPTVRERPEEEEPRIYLVRSYQGLARVAKLTEMLDEARAAFEDAIRLAQELAAEHPNVTDYQIQLLIVRADFGRVLLDSEQREEAIEAFRTSAEEFEKILAQHPNLRMARNGLAFAYRSLASAYEASGDKERASEAERRATEVESR